MNWRAVAASAIGSSHVASGGVCEDSCWTTVDTLSDGGSLLLMFVSDGAGSASRGAAGAELAIQTAAEFMGKRVKQVEFGLNDALAVELIVAVRDCIYATAETERLRARDYACTFIGVLSSARGTLVLQVGDGGVVIDVGAGLEVPVVPMSGEYANMTHFVTDEDAVSRLATRTYDDPALRVAVFSDGLQRLALNIAANTPHGPFFAPFFKGLQQALPEQEDQLSNALDNFLRSQAVNERTDDDKTLALAVMIP